MLTLADAHKPIIITSFGVVQVWYPVLCDAVDMWHCSMWTPHSFVHFRPSELSSSASLCVKYIPEHVFESPCSHV